VDVLGNRASILRRDADRRHRLLTVHDDWRDQLALLIVEHRIGSQEVGAALIAAAQIGAVADAAMHTIEPGAARD
jgi:hypothetical protein